MNTYEKWGRGGTKSLDLAKNGAASESSNSNPLLSSSITENLPRLARLAAAMFFWSGGNAHAAKFIRIVFPEKQIPLFAAFENFFLL
jgi:hypothetical protein